AKSENQQRGSEERATGLSRQGGPEEEVGERCQTATNLGSLGDSARVNWRESRLEERFAVEAAVSAAERALKSPRRKSGKRCESSTRGAGRSPPRLIADDPIHVDSPILLVGFDSGF